MAETSAEYVIKLFTACQPYHCTSLMLKIRPPTLSDDIRPKCMWSVKYSRLPTDIELHGVTK